VVDPTEGAEDVCCWFRRPVIFRFCFFLGGMVGGEGQREIIFYGWNGSMNRVDLSGIILS
jgi:hypothetical protein